MAKLFFFIILIFSVAVCGRNIVDLHKQDSSEEETSAIPHHQKSKLQGLFEHLLDYIKSGNKTFPDGFLPKLPELSINFTAEDVKELLKIVENRNLTKAELNAELDKWIKHLGGEAPEKFSELLEKVEKFKKSVRDETAEVVANVTSLIDKIYAVEDNMDITRDKELKQISALLKGQSYPIVQILMSMKGLAYGDVISAMIREIIANVPRPSATSQ